MGFCLYCKREFRKREQKYKFCSLFCANNFNKNGLKKIDLPLFSDQLAELVGICLGHGNITKYQTSVALNSNADKDYISYVMNLMKNLFPQSGTISLIVRKDNVADIRINSAIIANFFKEMGIVANNKIVPSWIYSSKTFQYACVRGLFDTEGSISFKKYLSKKGTVFYKQLNFRNTNMLFMRFVRDVLLGIGLKPTMTLKKSLYISNQRDIDIFRDIIGFSNPKLERKSKMLLLL